MQALGRDCTLLEARIEHIDEALHLPLVFFLSYAMYPPLVSKILVMQSDLIGCYKKIYIPAAERAYFMENHLFYSLLPLEAKPIIMREKAKPPKRKDLFIGLPHFVGW